MRIGVHGFVKNINGEVLVIKRSEADEDEPNTWDLPGGAIDTDSVEVGFKRETKEETNLEVGVIRLLGAYTIDEPGLNLFVRARVG